MPVGVYPRRAALDRFEEKYFPEPNSGCWLWIGATKLNGYGCFKLGRVMSAHRAAWLLFRGEIPPGLCVLHHCDNATCVNPEHLFVGTLSDNMQDMLRKGRSDRKGEKAPRAKLTQKDVARIRNGTEPVTQLAKELGVHYTTLSHIRARRFWKHVGG